MNLSKNLTIKSILCIDRKFLIYNLVLRNFKIRYRKSYIGILWTMLIPAANAVVYNIVFNLIMKVQIPNYLLFILSGLLPWSFFSTSIVVGTETLVNNHPVLNKVAIPPYAFVLAEVLTAFFNFILAIPVLLIVAILTGVEFQGSQLALPIAILLLFIQAFSVSLITSYLYVYFRDLKHIIAIVIQLWFYLTPIVYTSNMIPDRFKFFLLLNPTGMIFQFIHYTINSKEVFDYTLTWVPLAWTAVLLLLAASVVKKYNNTIVERL